MVTAITPTTTTCSARVGFWPGEWAEMPLFCSTSIGLVRYTDANGIERAYCHHHRGLVLYRYPAAPAKDECAVCHGPVDELAIRMNSGAQVVEVCWRCQEKAE